ncbi:MAG TPA: TolC family protein, partial [Thermoanaerobaculia bacterium]|nr:TolC family protein [Thermoanaerobaculia bacterium]
AGSVASQAQPPTPAARSLTLAESLGLAEQAGEGVRIARAEVTRAETQRRQARSERFPQLDATGSYTRTLHSEFQDVSFDFGGDGGSTDLSNLPFGQRNQYRLGLTVNQSLWSGGRITAQTRAAEAGVGSARVGLAATEAELALTVTQAYFDALLLDRLVNISEATLAQADRAFQQTELAHRVGNQSEFELLRAQVARDNERPTLVQRRADRDLAYARLAQLLDLPASEPLQLATSFDDFTAWEAKGAVPTAGARADWLAQVSDERAPVRQAQAAVTVQEQLVKVARAQRLPSVGVSSDYGRVAYPVGGLPGWSDTRTNWTVGLGLRVPLLTGGRLAAQEGTARADLEASRARLAQVRELAWLDGRDALDRLAAAEAVFQAAFGTIGQAQRAYEIAELRYKEGLSTQLELNDTRIQLTFAQGNAALAARNLQVARARVALLPDLPLGAGAGSILSPAAFGVPARAGANPLNATSPGGFPR